MRRSIWNVESLKEHLERLLAEKELRDQQRFDASQEALKEAITSLNGRLQLLNELREGVATEEQLEALKLIVEEIRRRQERTEGHTVGGRAQMTRLYAALGAAFILFSVIVFAANGRIG
jgi:hypothetical protein